MRKLLNIIGTLLLVSAIIVGIFFTGRMSYKWWPTREVVVHNDTTVVTDTLFKDRPVPWMATISGFIYLPVKDTVNLHDTTYLVIPKEKKVYQDSTYRAVVTGYQVDLESIAIYQKTQYIRETKEVLKRYKPRFTFGVQAGYGLVIPNSGAVSLGGYAGFGVQYNF